LATNFLEHTTQILGPAVGPLAGVEGLGAAQVAGDDSTPMGRGAVRVRDRSFMPSVQAEGGDDQTE
jgi:hypothetical protein